MQGLQADYPMSGFAREAEASIPLHPDESIPYHVESFQGKIKPVPHGLKVCVYLTAQECWRATS